MSHTSPDLDSDAGRTAIAKDLSCADVVDALGRLHRHRAHLTGLISPTPSRKVFGRAVTISYFPSCSEMLDAKTYNFGSCYEAATRASAAAPGSTVLVLASNGLGETSMAGGTKLSRLTRDGLAGVVTDGRLRDFDEMTMEPYSAWCSGEAVAWGGGTLTPYLSNVPVVIRGVAVYPGQYIFADRTGLAVIPESVISEVLATALQIVDDDKRFRSSISLGGSAPSEER